MTDFVPTIGRRRRRLQDVVFDRPVAILLALTAARFAVAACTPLSPDEAYYWVWSRALAPGYFDHPPMVALFIRAGTLLFGASPFGIRFMAPVAAALGSWLLARAGRDLFGDWRSGVRAAVLVNATLLFGVGSVTITPDTPLLLFWTAMIAAMARLIATGDARWWLAAGIAAGLALDSKLTGLLLGPCMIVWMVFSSGALNWLRGPWPFAAACLAACLFAPVLVWNARHDWIGLAKQGSRVGDWHPAHALRTLAELAGGQIGLATPLLFVVFAAGAAWTLRRRRDPACGLLAAFMVVPAAVFLTHAFGDRVQANWPSILYPSAALAASRVPGWAGWRVPAAAVGVLLTFLVWTQASVAPLALPRGYDPTLMRLGGWRELARGVEAAARRDHAHFVAADNYGQAAMMALLLPPDIAVLGAEGRWRFFALPLGGAGQSGLLLHSARRAPPDAAGWTKIEKLSTIVRSRNDLAAETHEIYRVTPAVGLAVMPRP